MNDYPSSRWTIRLVAPLALGLLLPHATALAQFKPLSGHEYREVNDPKRQVSGQMVVGMSVVDRAQVQQLEATQRESRTLRVNLPKDLPASARIRVDLDSPDGKFHGTGVWQLERAEAGWAELTLLEKGQPQRPRLGSGHLAVSVQAFGPDPAASPRTLLASLAPQDSLKGDTGTRELWLQVNSRRGQIMVKGSGAAQKCERVDSPSVVRFDTLCKIALSEVAGADNRIALKLIRRDGFASEAKDVVFSAQLR